MRAEDIIQAAMSGQRIEQVPKNFDFNPQVEKLNQVLSYEVVNALVNQNNQDQIAEPHIISRNPVPGSNQKQRTHEVSDHYTSAGIGLDLMNNSAQSGNNLNAAAPYSNNQHL